MKVLEKQDYQKIFFQAILYNSVEKVSSYFEGKFNEVKECNSLLLFIDGLEKAYNAFEMQFKEQYYKDKTQYSLLIQLNPANKDEFELPDLNIHGFPCKSIDFNMTGHYFYKDIVRINDGLKHFSYRFTIEQTNKVEDTRNDIDFNQTSPEYFLNKSEELETKYKVEFQITEQWIAELDPLNTHKGLKVGEIATRFPEWPNDPRKAFKLVKEYYAKVWLLSEVIGFLEKFYSWNEKAMIEKLDQINQFITEANKIKLDYAFRDKYFPSDERQKVVYLRITNDYYNKNNIQIYGVNDLYDAKNVYGTYILFKELLEEKLNTKAEINLPQLPTSPANNQRSKSDELLKNRILPDYFDKYIEIEKELITKGYINSEYKWQKHKTELAEFSCVIISYRFFKPLVNGKRIQDFHKRQFISERYGFGKTGLTETWKKTKPKIEFASIPFNWIKRPD